MMSLRAVHAGAGYQYLLASVATNDANDPSTDEGKLSAYYQAKGTPPGKWIGRGLAALNSKTAAVGVEIESDQMFALYGVGYHPDTHAMIEADKSLEECKLGGKFPIYTNNIPVLNELRDAEAAMMKATGRLLSDEERTDLAISIGREYYIMDTGWVDAPDKDVVDWVNTQRNQVKQAVSAFDLTFSPAKSISVLWALADEDTANKIAACHHEAVAEVLAWAEDHVVRTRMGAGGLAQVKTNGVIASEFTHFDTRAGDPDLHSHVLVSNKVQGPDGKWRALDSRAMFKHHQTLSARYDVVVQELLTRKLGLKFHATSRGQGKEPVWEVAGVPQQLIDLFSKRRTMARPVYEQLLEAYVTKHGHQPDKRTQMGLWQSAILDTRDAKKPAESLNALRTTWRSDVEAREDTDELFAALRSVVAGEVTDTRPEFYTNDVVDESVLDDRCRVVIDRMIQKRSYFSRHHVTAAVGAYLKGFSFSDAHHTKVAIDEMVERIIDHHFVELTPGKDRHLPQALIGQDGQAVDRHLGFAKYTTPEILAQEDHVLRSVCEPTALFASEKIIASCVKEFEKANGFCLNEGQENLARHLLTTGTVLGCGIGPAGTGKTTSMQIVASAWKKSGRGVVGLAPSAAAAGVLGDKLGIDAFTIDSLTYVWRGRHPEKPAGDVSALPIEIRPGDMLLVDEAGMATTDNLAALTEIAEATGAVVRLIGDPHQLDAVGTGGLFSTLCRYSDAAELTTVMRFAHGNDTEQADASLALRRGDTTAISFYNNRGWISEGTRIDMLADAVQAYLADVGKGRCSLIVASTNSDVAAINAMIREHYIAAGVVDTTREVSLAQGEKAGEGDIIIARKNKRLPNANDPALPGGKVFNGQLFRVLDIHADGSVTAADMTTGEVWTLPADYVAENMHLGYGSTVHRAQGATVETTHAVVDARTSRSGLYVALTRGKRENRIYAVTDDDVDELAEAAHEHSASNTKGLSGMDVLARALARDDRQRSATDIRQEATEYANSRERLEKLYAYAHDQATAVFIDSHLGSWWDVLDADAETRLNDEGRSKIRAAWRDVVRHGRDPREFMATAVANLGNAVDVGSVIAWRVRNLAGCDKPVDATAPLAPPPVTRGCDLELAEWMSTTYQRLTQWEVSEVERLEETINALSTNINNKRAELEQLHARARSIDDQLNEFKRKRSDLVYSRVKQNKLAAFFDKRARQERIAALNQCVDDFQALYDMAWAEIRQTAHTLHQLEADKSAAEKEKADAIQQHILARRQARRARSGSKTIEQMTPQERLAAQFGSTTPAGSKPIEEMTPQERLAAQFGRQRQARSTTTRESEPMWYEQQRQQQAEDGNSL